MLREWQCDLSKKLKAACVLNGWKNDTFASQYRGKYIFKGEESPFLKHAWGDVWCNFEINDTTSDNKQNLRDTVRLSAKQT